MKILYCDKMLYQQDGITIISEILNCLVVWMNCLLFWRYCKFKCEIRFKFGDILNTGISRPEFSFEHHKNVNFLLYGLHCDIHYFRHNEDSLMESVGDHHDKSCTSPDFRSRSLVHQAQEVFPGRRVSVIICTFFDVGLMTVFSTCFRVVSFVALDLLFFSFNLHGVFCAIWYAGVYCLIILDTLGYRTFCV